ncbi:hypothetical protein X975_12530, partial [Stegodyphus mimosarum]
MQLRHNFAGEYSGTTSPRIFHPSIYYHQTTQEDFRLFILRV